jgi:very-short-patch-repair endonuclease
MENKYIEYDLDFLIGRSLKRKWWHLPYNSDLKQRASHMRKNMTGAEKYLWSFLKWNKLWLKVLRQKIIDNYIVDFYISEYMLVIEVDWEIHDIKKQKEYDNIRTDLLETYNIKVMRFTNQQVLENIESVLNIIKKYTTFPPLRKEG